MPSPLPFLPTPAESQEHNLPRPLAKRTYSSVTVLTTSHLTDVTIQSHVKNALELVPKVFSLSKPIT